MLARWRQEINSWSNPAAVYMVERVVQLHPGDEEEALEWFMGEVESLQAWSDGPVFVWTAAVPR